MADDMNHNDPARTPADVQPGSADRAGQNLLAQARRLRQSHSTADIILDDRAAPRISRRTYLYLLLALGCLIVLVYLFTAASSRRTMENRLAQISRTSAKLPPTVQSTSPENEHAPEPVAATTGADGRPVGPFDLASGTSRSTVPIPPVPPSTKPAGTLQPAPQSPRPPQSASQIRPDPARQPGAPARTTAHPPGSGAKGAGSGGAGSPAYQLLLDSRPAFAAMLRGGSEEFHYQDFTATPKGENLSVLDFAFRRGSTEEIAHYTWEVDTQARLVRPIGLNAARFDRLQLKRGEGD